MASEAKIRASYRFAPIPNKDVSKLSKSELGAFITENLVYVKAARLRAIARRVPSDLSVREQTYLLRTAARVDEILAHTEDNPVMLEHLRKKSGLQKAIRLGVEAMTRSANL